MQLRCSLRLSGAAGLRDLIKKYFDIGPAGPSDEIEMSLEIGAAGLIQKIKKYFDIGPAGLSDEIEMPFEIGAAGFVHKLRNALT